MGLTASGLVTHRLRQEAREVGIEVSDGLAIRGELTRSAVTLAK